MAEPTAQNGPAWPIGIEEEYLLVDRETRDLVRDPPRSIIDECNELLEGQVGPEFLRSQIEVGTRVCSTLQEAREDLARLRLAVSEVAARHGMAPISASTHPFATWGTQLTTDHERYTILARDMQAVIRRLVICGMHVHVGFDDDDLRIDLMNQVTYFLPHLLALSTSSPFWEGTDTGLCSFRLSVFRGAPRTGLPPRFASWSEYERHIGVLVDAGIIEDGTKLWWDIRPSARYPTVEMRIPDVCTRLDDAITVAALYRCILSMLYRMRSDNQKWRSYENMLLQENVWRAQRYGVRESLMDFGLGKLVPYGDLLEELIEMVGPDAEALGCRAEVEGARRIVAEGTSADRQVAAHQKAIDAGADPHEALQAVVDFLIEETVVGL